MNYTIPEKLPHRCDFVNAFLEAIFPDFDFSKNKKGPYAYTALCNEAATKLGIPPTEENMSKDESGVDVPVDSVLFKLMFEMNDSYKKIFGKESSLITQEDYKRYTGTLFTFCSQTSGIMKTWMKKTSDSNRINKSFDAAVFFTYLLLFYNTKKESKINFFKYCLKTIGIEGFDGVLDYVLFNFDWEETVEKETIGGRTFNRLKTKSIVMLGVAVLTIMELIGTYDSECDSEKIETAHEIFKEFFSNEISAVEMFDLAEVAVFNSNKFYEPRSIVTTNSLYPQDFFVIPNFSNGKAVVESPTTEIIKSNKSKRILVTAKTGLGKSAYLQMITLCILKSRYSKEIDGMDKLNELSLKLNIPEDMYIITVPAKMFSYCYNKEKYKEWTNDLVKLFFNCMWNLSNNFNFFSEHNSQRFSQTSKDISLLNHKVTDELVAYVKELGRNGKLLLVLDSFDEIASGEMRRDYIRAVSSFYDNYCCCYEDGDVGAHVIVSSREMSPQTMQLLKAALELNEESDLFTINSFNSEQKKKLVYKWHKFWGNIPKEETNKLLKEIEDNHYYIEYSSNPYMLSVICFYFRYGLKDCAQRMITSLVDKLIKNYNRTSDRKDVVIQDVVMNITKILQEIAGETITAGEPHFSRQKLNRYIYKFIDKTDLTEKDIEQYIERLHEIFVTGVGLIVPADGNDSDYQFINNQIRFELAARGMQRALEDDEKITVYREVIFPSIAEIREYVGLLIPLLCNINLENPRLAEYLIWDLVMYDFKDEEEESLLIEAMLDLILPRYGNNISTTVILGRGIEGFVRRVQRMLILRIFTSSKFNPTDSEKEGIKCAPAFMNNKTWLSESLQNLIN